MKPINIIFLAIIISSCNQNPIAETGTENPALNKQDTSIVSDNPIEERALTEEVAENTPDKYYGYWKADDNSGEVLRLFNTPSFQYISDGQREIPVVYDKKGDKFTLHQTEFDVEIIYSAEPKQIFWKVTKFGQSEGEIIRKYNFLKD